MRHSNHVLKCDPLTRHGGDMPPSANKHRAIVGAEPRTVHEAIAVLVGLPYSPGQISKLGALFVAYVVTMLGEGGVHVE